MLNRINISPWAKRLGLAFSVIVLLAAGTAVGNENLIDGELESASRSRSRAPVCCALVGFYQRIISPIGASSCRMCPSCSAFAREAFARHGFLRGMMLTSDRLMRDSFFAGTEYPLICKDGRWLHHDPLRENTLWWRRDRGRTIVRHGE